MPTRFTRSTVAALAALLMAALTACSGADNAKDAADGSVASPLRQAASQAPEKALTRGTCWDDQQLAQALGAAGFSAWVQKYAGGDATLGASMRDDAAFAGRVDCAKPHALELYDVVSLTPALTARITSYAALLDQTSALYRQVRDQVNDRCLAASAYGRAQRAAGGLPVQLGPSLSATGGLHVAWDPFPADLWAKGHKKFVCTFEQDRPGTLRFAQLTTKAVPSAARVCLNTPARYLPCSGRHQAEDVAEMILNTAIDSGRINGRTAVRTGPQGKYVALSDAEYATLDKVCTTFLRSVSSGRAGVTARAYPGSVAQWPTTTGAYVASCFAVKPFGDPPPAYVGTVFDKS